MSQIPLLQARQPLHTYIWGLLQIDGHLIQVNKDGSSGTHLARNLFAVHRTGNEPKLLTVPTHACPFVPVVDFTIMIGSDESRLVTFWASMNSVRNIMRTIGRDRVGQDKAHLSVGHGPVSSPSNWQSKSLLQITLINIIFSQIERTH